MWLQPAREACGQFPPVPEAWPLGGRPRRSQTTVSHLPFPKGPGDAAQVPLWALAPEEPQPSRVVNVKKQASISTPPSMGHVPRTVTLEYSSAGGISGSVRL